MRNRLLQALFLTASVVVLGSNDPLLQAQANNCNCLGWVHGFLPLPLLDPVCVEEPYNFNFFAFTPQSCAANCAALASTTAAATCGTECQRGEFTYQVISYSWSGAWFYAFAASGNHHQYMVAC